MTHSHQQLEHGLADPAKPVKRQPRPSTAEQRRLIDGAMGELLMLLGQKANHDVLTQKVEALHGQIHALLRPERQALAKPDPGRAHD